jgi:RNA polymerase sigma-70 factor (ECF subfamily)
MGNDPSTSTDAGHSSIQSSLLVRVREHDSVAWNRLFALYSPTVMAWSKKAGLGESDAQDVVQEVFQAVNRKIGTFSRVRPGDSFRGWLYGIFRHKLMDHFRAHARRPAPAGGTDAQQWLMEIPAAEEHESEEDAQADRSAVFGRALDLIRAEFGEKTWRAFWMAGVERRPAAEIAVELGTTPGAVYVAKSRVLKRLRMELAGLEETGE